MLTAQIVKLIIIINPFVLGHEVGRDVMPYMTDLQLKLQKVCTCLLKLQKVCIHVYKNFTRFVYKRFV